QAKAALSKWANKPHAEPDQITKKRRETWENLNQFLIENGASITSVRYASPVRLEFDPESQLPERLHELGYDLNFLEQTTRIGSPVSARRGRFLDYNASHSFRSVNVYELRLPK